MLKLQGTLINYIDKTTYTKKGELPVPTKAKLQILVEVKRANGNVIKELHTISIPDEKILMYKDKLGKEIQVDVGIISKEKISFYGV